MVKTVRGDWGEYVLIWGVPKKNPHKGLEVFAALPAPFFLKDKIFSEDCQKSSSFLSIPNTGMTSAAWSCALGTTWA